MRKLIIAGNGTDVGKTVVSAILMTLLRGDYWKPIQCGDEGSTDSKVIESLIDPNEHTIFPPAYSFTAPYSPHYASKLEQTMIEPSKIFLPLTERSLIIEMVGGVLVPLTNSVLSIDVFATFGGEWIIVSKNYLGSINHTLLTIESLRQRKVNILGIIFNGTPNPSSEEAILQFSSLSFLARILPQQKISRKIIQQHSLLWQEFPHHFLQS